MSEISWQRPNKNKGYMPTPDDPEYGLVWFTYGVNKFIRMKYTLPYKGLNCQFVYYVNQDGLQHRDLPISLKTEFKAEIMKQWHTILPQLPTPFTGNIELHSHQGKLCEVKFISKP